MKDVSLVYLIFINVLTFAVYGIDKYKAIHNQYRISENALFFLAMIGGSIGAYASMYTFRHKTKHKSFTIGIPLIMLAQFYYLFNI